MLIYRLSQDALTELGEHTDSRYVDLLVQPVGDFTVASLITSGQCAAVGGEWVVPDVVTTAHGNAKANELNWSSQVSTNPSQIEYTITARDVAGTVVKQSKHINVLRGFEKVIPSGAHLITTTKGPMLTSDLIFKSPADGVAEYWYPTVAEPVSPLDRVETEVLADGTKRYLELVHRSAVATSA